MKIRLRVAAALALVPVAMMAAPARTVAQTPTKAAAQAGPDGGPTMRRLLACRAIAAPEQRLACFDAQSTSVSTAIQRRDLAVIERADVDRNRRTMFGLTSPDEKVLSRAIARTAPPPLKQDDVVRSVAPAGYGKYAMTLAGGAVWRNVDLLDGEPPVGAKVHIDKTPFGAYLLKIVNFQSVHAVRLR